MAKVEVVEKKENPLLRTILRIGAVVGGIYLLCALHPILTLITPTAEETLWGVRGTVLLNGEKHGVTLGVKVGNRSIGLVARR